MVKRSGLGRGLEALIPGSDLLPTQGTITFIEVDKIFPNPRQPRRRIDPDDLDELTTSVSDYGVLQPLIISPGKESGEYILIAGERRLQASRLAGLTRVPVVIREVSDIEQLELALIENVQRTDLMPLEEAEAYRQLSEEFHLSHEAISRKVGKSRVAVSNMLRLLKLADPVKNALNEARISEGHARALLALNSPEAQVVVLKTVITNGLNVRQTEDLVRKFGGKREATFPKAGNSPEIIDLESRLRNSLGTQVTIRAGKRGGSMTIFYYSNEELERLLERLIDEKNPA
jgi:ParB family chromosome partitioning protein